MTPAQARRERGPGHRAAIALTGDVDPALLRTAGWHVHGRLPRTPYEDPGDAPSFVDLDELLGDDRVDAVALVPEQAEHLPALREAGLLVLLTAPVTDGELLRRSRNGPVDLAVALHRRWEPWCLTTAAVLPLAQEPVRQATVRGWPTGERETVELVDLVRGWCGDVLAVGAGRAAAAERLPDGSRVAFSLLTASGATVLVSHEGSPVPLVRLTTVTARLDASPDEVRWEGGSPLPVEGGGLGPDAGLVACARALLTAVPGGEILDASWTANTVRPEDAGWPWPADLGDLLAASQVLQALRTSGVTGGLTRT